MPRDESFVASLRRPAGHAAVGAAAAVLCSGAAMAAGMPQLDFANPLTTSQVLWALVIFALLYFVLSRSALPAVGGVLDQRTAAIEADLETARVAKSTADAAVAEMTGATSRARADAQAAINAAVTEAKQAAAARSAELNARLEMQLKAAEDRIVTARTDAMKALRHVATEAATAIIGRLTGTAPDPQTIDGAVGSALATRGDRG